MEKSKGKKTKNSARQAKHTSEFIELILKIVRMASHRCSTTNGHRQAPKESHTDTDTNTDIASTKEAGTYTITGTHTRRLNCECAT